MYKSVFVNDNLMTSVNPEISCIRMWSGPALFGLARFYCINDALFQVGRVTSVRLTSMVVPTLTVSWVWIVWTSLLQEWGQCVVHALRDIVEMGQSAPVSYIFTKKYFDKSYNLTIK